MVQFVSYVRRVLHKMRLIFSRINGPNLFLVKGVFPYKLKIAKLIRVFKAGDFQYFTNYHPISLLSNFSKLFERVMHNRITNFLDC